MIRFILYIIPFIFVCSAVQGQKTSWDFDGQVSLFSSYLPDAVYPLQTGGRYIPEISFLHQIDTTRRLDGEMSLNTYWSNDFKSFDDLSWDVDLNPYRIWLRYSEQQWEVRAGLQKIDFGAAFALRPLQWFNQIDPRDPLQITNGVYGILGRYYFLNNANIWIWGLYGNEKPRGLDFLESISTFPEFGARVQVPIPKGELGLSYHQRRADFSVVYPLPPIPKELQGPEYKMGLDIKMDVIIGLWLEASYTTLDEAVYDFRNQFFSTLGMDYTFGIGNGLNLIVEHMMFSFDDTAFEFEKPGHFTAGILSYPLGLNDNINSILYYNWEGKDLSFFINYQHSFPVVTAYLMAFYIPESQGGIQLSESFTAFSGPRGPTYVRIQPLKESTMNKETIISLENVTKQFKVGDGHFTALSNINLEFNKGEFAGLVGPSGSGKTTLLNIIGSLDKPTEGEAVVMGKNISKLTHKESAYLRNMEIGFIFQVYNLLPVYTVFENIEFALLLQNKTAEERKKAVMEALDWVGLADMAKKKPSKLSGGEGQRVAIARAMVKRPTIVLADEPSANLDSENAHGILKTMKQLNEELKTTFVFSTHDEKVMKYLDRIIRLEDGKVVKDEMVKLQNI